MSTMLSTPLSSPTFTATSTASSFDFISTRSRSSSTDSSQSLQFSEDSDDEIVWSVASSDILSPSVLSASESSILSASEDDFVLLETRGSSLSTPHSHAAASLASDLQGLTLSSPATPTNATKPIKKCRNKPLALTTRPPSVATLTAAPSSPRRKRARKPKDTASTGLGARPIVDDVSEGVSEPLEDVVNPPSVYEDAVRYINSFLTNPGSSVCRLTLLQSLIIELGLASSSLPASLSAAKAYLKSRAFVNIRDYLAVRGQGPQAVQATMHPSRSALIKDIRRKKNQASLKWVKQNGLGVLLVQCFH